MDGPVISAIAELLAAVLLQALL